MRKAEIYSYDRLAGLLVEDENGYTFQYNSEERPAAIALKKSILAKI